MHSSTFLSTLAVSAAGAASLSSTPNGACPKSGGWLPSWCQFGSSQAPAPSPKVVQSKVQYRPQTARPKCPSWHIRGLGGPVDNGNNHCCIPGKAENAINCCHRPWIDKLRGTPELSCSSSMWETPKTYRDFYECNTKPGNAQMCRENRIIVFNKAARKQKPQKPSFLRPSRQEKQSSLPPKVPKPAALPPRIPRPSSRVIQSNVKRHEESGRNSKSPGPSSPARYQNGNAPAEEAYSIQKRGNPKETDSANPLLDMFSQPTEEDSFVIKGPANFYRRLAKDHRKKQKPNLDYKPPGKSPLGKYPYGNPEPDDLISGNREQGRRRVTGSANPLLDDM
ncbi:hypothetical protein PpBr36_02668 [Pyricularia pennisetigena]|uniref:hypothetical protein n=1 Tax=Pyricularia pennisetigena TaxID=1578925 RepID=UPI00114FC7DE|nr:hypothetical protein PpBr36_02668 [Pyricularia pennisetigena]TLS30841.1 hypothetical protein PpBr36_02668 [Pyricularia pennisetigena]